MNVRPSRSLRFLLSMHITVKHNVTNMKSGKSCTRTIPTHSASHEQHWTKQQKPCALQRMV